MTDGAILAFYIGPSGMVGGTKTEMVAWANRTYSCRSGSAQTTSCRDGSGRSTRRPLKLRHQLELTDWKLDPDIPADAFVSEKAKGRAADQVRPAGRRRYAAGWPEAAWESEAVQARRQTGDEVALMGSNAMKAIARYCRCPSDRAPFGRVRPCRWTSANRYGGSTSHTYGETSHTNAYGGSSYHSYGQGTEHTNMYGGSSAHAYGGGTEHTNAYGGTTYGAYGAGATHTYASGASVYHPPG